ncbi:MAG: prolipoprotein diacylglyceryl transferase [Peptococcaceae bacterium]|nr:prolipoprotein diacylglyceryl transferase [Peptococcaceae bacterium]
MDPIAFEIGPIAVHWYGILIAIAFLIGVWGSLREAKLEGLNEDHFLNLVIAVIICAIVGARAYYVIFEWDYYSQCSLWEIIATWHGGLAIHGGVIGGMLAAGVCAWRYRMRIWQLFDIIAPFLILGQAIGRWGNFFNQEAYGYEVDPNVVPWAMFIDGAWRHPTFLYESVWDVIGFLILILISQSPKLKEGDVALLYLVYYSVGRFVIEGFRTDSLMLGPLRVAQVVCIVSIAAAVVIAVVRRKKAPSRGDYLALKKKNKKG